MTGCEVLLCDDFSSRGKKIISAMIEAAPAKVKVSSRWTGTEPVLMTYGLGHMERRHWVDEHRKRGGRVIGWDLGYWDRDIQHDFAMRVTIDHDHPWRMVRPMPTSRFDSAGIRLRNDHDPDGPIILVGLTNKQRRWKGLKAHAWERSMILRLQEEFPGRTILYRPKKHEEAPGSLSVAKGDIETVLKGASLVVCSHSNVAIDACIAGIPVRCEDGAAYALYQHGSEPSEVDRLELLRSVAWWQWSCAEAAQAWQFITARLAE